MQNVSREKYMQSRDYCDWEEADMRIVLAAQLVDYIVTHEVTIPFYYAFLMPNSQPGNIRDELWESDFNRSPSEIIMETYKEISPIYVSDPDLKYHMKSIANQEPVDLILHGEQTFLTARMLRWLNLVDQHYDAFIAKISNNAIHTVRKRHVIHTLTTYKEYVEHTRVLLNNIPPLKSGDLENWIKRVAHGNPKRFWHFFVHEVEYTNYLYNLLTVKDVVKVGDHFYLPNQNYELVYRDVILEINHKSGNWLLMTYLNDIHVIQLLEQIAVQNSLSKSREHMVTQIVRAIDLMAIWRESNERLVCFIAELCKLQITFIRSTSDWNIQHLKNGKRYRNPRDPIITPPEVPPLPGHRQALTLVSPPPPDAKYINRNAHKLCYF